MERNIMNVVNIPGRSGSLAGIWDFKFLGDVSADSLAISELIFDKKIPVPSAFDAMPDYAGKRGVAAYRTKFILEAGCRGRLEFGAVSMWCRIYIDGKMEFEHACGYSPFSVDILSSKSEVREMIVIVDNRFDFDRVPMHEEYFDFYQYGGILRDVVLHRLPGEGVFIDALHVTPTAGYREGEVEVHLHLGGSVPAELKFSIQFDQSEVKLSSKKCSSETIKLILKVPSPQVWSPKSPQIHQLRVALLDESGIARDWEVVRFGLRRIESKDGALWLNEEKLQLRGYNRHEWHPNYGPCTSLLQMASDLQLMRDMGCNFIRGSHYPQDQRFLDLCDEMGFLVWEENLGWGQRAKTFASEKFVSDHDLSLREMVKASFNHPSIIIWGFLNEAASNEEYVRGVFERSVKTLRELDSSRLITYASMYAKDDKYFELVDVISLNLYPGWYGCDGVPQPLERIKPVIHETIDVLDAKGFKDKPILVSEIGAEGLYGWHDPHGDFYTEEYQAEYLKRASETVLDHPRCFGIALWHFSDARTYGGSQANAMMRPRCFNNKGTLDEYRRPKLAYKAVKEIFLKAGLGS